MECEDCKAAHDLCLTCARHEAKWRRKENGIMREALIYFAEADCDGGHDIPRNTDPRGFTIALQALGVDVPEGNKIPRPWSEAAIRGEEG